MLTYERANELFHYDRSSGKLIRKVTTDYKAVKGTEAGTNAYGYKLVCIDKVKYKVHRVCMLLAYGYFPKGMQVDHINHDRSDNRLSNMRFVTDHENAKKTIQLIKITFRALWAFTLISLGRSTKRT